MKRLYTILYGMLLTGQFLTAADKTAQQVRVEIYRLQRQDSCMALDMNIDLTDVRLAPDCTVYLYPYLKSDADSLMLPPVMLNGPQSDRMYRRRKALGQTAGIEKLPPYVVLREGDHPLPRINYSLGSIPHQPWMDNSELVIYYESPNADARLAHLNILISRIPPVVVERRDTLVVHDTIRIAVGSPLDN